MTRPLAAVEALLDKQITAGQAILDRSITNQTAFATAKSDMERWHGKNREVLRQCFTGDVLLAEYNGPGAWGSFGLDKTLQQEVQDFKDDNAEFLNRLRGVRERLDLYISESSNAESNAPSNDAAKGSSITYNIHGHAIGWQQGSNNQQNVVGQGTLNVGPTVDELVRLLQDSDLGEADKEDALQAAEDIRKMAAKDTPGRAERVRRRLDSIATWIGTGTALTAATAPLLVKLRHLFGLP